MGYRRRHRRQVERERAQVPDPATSFGADAVETAPKPASLLERGPTATVIGALLGLPFGGLGAVIGAAAGALVDWSRRQT